MTTVNTENYDQILKTTSQDMVDIIYDTLEIIDRIFRSANIEYTLFCGTMLGSHRHGDLIPWDDDGDLAIQRKDEEKLLALEKIFADQGYVLRAEPIFGYRIWDSNRTIIRNCDQICIPFIDIFLIDRRDNEYVYITKDAHISFPGEPLPFGCFQRLTDVPFGHLTLRGLNINDGKRQLDENFGNDWNEIAWRDFDHVTGDSFDRVSIRLDQPHLRHPAIHSKFMKIK